MASGYFKFRPSQYTKLIKKAMDRNAVCFPVSHTRAYTLKEECDQKCVLRFQLSQRAKFLVCCFRRL